MRVSLKKGDDLKFPSVLGFTKSEYIDLYSKVADHVIMIIVASFADSHTKSEEALNKYFEDVESYGEKEKYFMLMIFGEICDDIEQTYGEKLAFIATKVAEMDDETWYAKVKETYQIRAKSVHKEELFSFKN